MRTFIGLTPERATTIVIGLAYLCAGAILFYGALYPEGRWLALVAGAAWLTAHGVFHVVERANDTASFERFTRAAPGVLGPRLMGWCALAILIARQRISPAGLPTSLFLSAVEKLAPGDNAYVHALAREHINVALRGGSILTGDQLTAFQFGQAIAGHSPDAFALGDKIEQQ